MKKILLLATAFSFSTMVLVAAGHEKKGGKKSAKKEQCSKKCTPEEMDKCAKDGKHCSSGKKTCERKKS